MKRVISAIHYLFLAFLLLCLGTTVLWGQSTPAELTVVSLEAPITGQVEVPVRIKINDNHLLGADLVFLYDPEMLILADVTTGVLTENMLLVYHVPEPGQISVSMAGAYPVTENGDIMNLVFQVVECTENDVAVAVAEALLNEGETPVETFDGAISFPDCLPDPFVRGDVNGDSFIDLSDPVVVLLYLFYEGMLTTCPKVCDANDDGRVDLADPVFLLAYLFAEGDVMPAPYPECGVDPTPDALSCENYERCIEP